MPVKMQPTSVIKAHLGIDPNGRIHTFFTNTCYKRMTKYVPMSNLESKGQLRENVHINTDSITYESPYAHAQYVGYTSGPVVNYTTPGTGPYWDQRMWNVESQDIIKEVQKVINHGG